MGSKADMIYNVRFRMIVASRRLIPNIAYGPNDGDGSIEAYRPFLPFGRNGDNVRFGWYWVLTRDTWHFITTYPEVSQ
jgi:hypothetical protein